MDSPAPPRHHLHCTAQAMATRPGGAPRSTLAKRAMTTSRINQYGLQVAKPLYDFIEQEALPGTELDSASCWKGFSALAHDLAPRNRELLAQRDRFQQQLDD